ncbi:hypothetical protein QUH46_06025 [Klebsiella grimontii]|nr:hypothetical protein [Klebsiella grimontii]MDM6727089.1 hypothetical protein [Klebsiella grimontii]MDM7220939.1 hypothetical protein [Klebsiella grimontii]MDM7237110.1 hypothetical protein [Klebsiella grimontii]MDM7268394.1 hypothetical protein [Klebsiella grimontii]
MQITLSMIDKLINDRFLHLSSVRGLFMNIHQGKLVKETTHPRPTNAIPPVLWMQAAIITLGAFSTMLSSTMLSAALPAMAIGLGVPDSAIQWIATAYLMALAAGVR